MMKLNKEYQESFKKIKKKMKEMTKIQVVLFDKTAMANKRRKDAEHDSLSKDSARGIPGNFLHVAWKLLGSFLIHLCYFSSRSSHFLQKHINHYYVALDERGK